MKVKNGKKETKAGESLQLETLFGHETGKAVSSESLGETEKYKLQNRKSTLGRLSKSHELAKT